MKEGVLLSSVIIGKNDLETWCKQNNKEYILQEWDYNANAPFTPQNIAAGSNKKFSWVCSEGHKWIDSVYYRTKVSTKCPYCTGKIVITGFNDLATTHPEILKNWNYEKNSVLPTEITKRNHNSEYFWWKCEKGHEWQARLSNKINLDRGCPYCSNHKVLTGFNDLETWCKEHKKEALLKEWDYEKNDILPSQISYANNKKVWWKCNLSHEWDATIGSRTTGRPSGCPFCSNPPKRILIGFNDFESWCHHNHKEYLLKEWDYDKNGDLSPKDFSYGSGKGIWWKCNKNHHWKVSIANRVHGTNCPICARTQTSFPEQTIAFYLMQEHEIEQRFRIKGDEVDIYIPKYNIAVEYDGKLWHSDILKQEHDSEKSKRISNAGVSLIRIKETENKKSIHLENGQYIIEFIAKNGKYITKDFEWALSNLINIIDNITHKTSSISINIERDQYLIRAHYMNVLNSNSVAAVFPELIPEWDIEKNEGVTPDAFSARNNKRVWWKCKNGHSWLASINTRGERKLGCPFCAGQRTVSGENDFETWCKQNNPTLLSEWDYQKNIINPSDIPKTYKEKMWWKCKNGHCWQATVYNRVNGTGCPQCHTGNHGTRNKVSLDTWCKQNNSNLCQEWNYEKNGSLTPALVSHGSHTKVWWICSKGHEWEAQIKSRTYNHGCPYCSGTNKKAITGINDLATWCKQNNKEYIIDEWDYDKNGELTPEKITWGSHKRINWKCSKGHMWEAVVKERTKLHGNTCPICKKL